MTDGGWASPSGPAPEPGPVPSAGGPYPPHQPVPPPAHVPFQPYVQQPYAQQPYAQQPYAQQPYAQQPWPPPSGPGPAPWSAPPPAAVHADAYRPREYPQLLRGPAHRGWKPVVSLLAGATVAFGAALATSFVTFALLLASTGSTGAAQRRMESEAFYGEPGGFLLNNVLLAALIPVAMGAVWLVHGWRPRWLASVRPGIRWTWLLECSLYAVAYVGVLVLVGLAAGDTYAWDPEPQLAAWVAVVLLTQPLQAAGEEYGFRGLLTQAIGSWFSRPVVAAVVAGLVTSTLFALAHGSQSPWLFADRFFFGATASYLVWRTGGLEAGIALHAVNNLWAVGASVAAGTVAETITATDYPPLAAAVDIAGMAVFAALVTWRARRRGLQRVHDPALQPGGAAPAGPYGVPVAAGPWGGYQALALPYAAPGQPGPPPAPYPAVHVPPQQLPPPAGPPQPGPRPGPPPGPPWGSGG